MYKKLDTPNHEKRRKSLDWETFLGYLKKYGWFLINSEIYSGIANSYDLGPFATHLKDGLIAHWKTVFLQAHDKIHLIDASLLLKRPVLEASGHLKRFHDYILTCQKCQKTVKIDEIWPQLAVNQLDFAEVKTTLEKARKKKCPFCQNWLQTTTLKQLDLLFSTGIGVDPKQQQKVYLRPETAQNIFINFPHLVRMLRVQPPFGIAQIGKVFRNEMTTEYFVFRTCEFNQMELEFFFNKSKDDVNWFQFWENQIVTFLAEVLKLNPNNWRQRTHRQEELAHYAQKTIDFEFAFPFGWKELWGLSDRGNYDLSKHEQKSGVKMNPLATNKDAVLPSVIEPSVGLERLMLAFLYDKLSITAKRFTLALPWKFAYYQIVVLPLTEKLSSEAYLLYKNLKKKWRVCFEAKKSIGKRYVYHDAIGTYYALTFDFESLKTASVTIRQRDTKTQKRVAIKNLETFFAQAKHE